MLLIISPAKKLDFSPIEIKNKLSNPIFQKDASTLASVASKLSKSELGQLMSISEKLADLNFVACVSGIVVAPFLHNPCQWYQCVVLTH